MAKFGRTGPKGCKLPTCDADFKSGFVQKDTPECCVPAEDEVQRGGAGYQLG